MLPRRITWAWISTGFWRFFRGLEALIRKGGVFSLLIGIGLWGVSLVMIAFQLVEMEVAGPIPSQQELANPDIPLASDVYSADKKLVGKLFRKERSFVPLDQISTCTVDALIATEDIRFYEHNGIDYYALARVLVKTLLLQNESSGGGSTLSMQLAKNLYPRQDFPYASLLVNKFREIVIAHRLEQVLSKQEILTHYLNTVSLSDNAFGVETGAQRFFGCSAASLKPEQAAVLMGMLKAPTAYNPRLNPENAARRRNLVLGQMGRYGYLSLGETDSLQALPMELNLSYLNYHDGPAPYFMAYVRQWLQKWAEENPKPDGTHWDPFGDGLHIYTTLDSRLQHHALAATRTIMPRIQRNFQMDWRWHKPEEAFEEVLERNIRRHPTYKKLAREGYSAAQIDSVFSIPAERRMFNWKETGWESISLRDSIFRHIQQMQMGFLALDPNTGDVLSWVGGIDHHYFQYDHVTARRQTGSVFKPLVYATALENGIQPCEYIPNEKVMFQEYDDWTPENSDQSYGGEYSMRGALTQSVNVVAVNLIMQLGPQKVISMARELGVEADIPAVPSIALGTADISLLEILQVYASFINGGKRVDPQVVTRIEDANGRVVYESAPKRLSPVLSPQTPALMTRMLRNVVNRGTARGVRSRYGLKQDLVGKTGTTQNQTDGWFVGASPSLVAGAWVGADDPQVHFRSMMYGQGASTSLHIWGDFFQRVAKDSASQKWIQGEFDEGPDELEDQLDCDDLWFPLSMTGFKSWWQEQKRKDSLLKVQQGLQ